MPNAHLHMPGERRVVERRAAVLVARVHMCARRHQQLHDVEAAAVGCKVERRRADVVACVHTRALRQQPRHGGGVARAGSLMQRTRRRHVCLRAGGLQSTRNRMCTPRGRVWMSLQTV
eukprot:263412-Chlamydomonas_euryale.AAC.3